MTVLLGSDAFSPFRMDALKDAIAKADPSVGYIDIDAKWTYALEPEEGAAIEPAELERAASLLNANGPLDDVDFFVFPRKGTISPWSSKATDIFRNCALKSIKRVERGIRFRVSLLASGSKAARDDFRKSLPRAKWLAAIYDKMTEGVYDDISDLFDVADPKPGRTFDVMAKGVAAIREANEELGLAISEPEMEYLAKSFAAAGRNPTDTELVMFGQVNSEHCRHKIFGAEFVINGKKLPKSLFEMIKNTHKKRPKDTLSAYRDNSAVVAGFKTDVFAIDPRTNEYGFKKDQLDQLMKVETHNHPTAISPFPGAATGVGGEIRDEAATGQGSRSIAGICGFMVSNLRIPGYPQPCSRSWSRARSAARRSATSSAVRSSAASSAPTRARSPASSAATTSRSCSLAAWASSATARSSRRTSRSARSSSRSAAPRCASASAAAPRVL